MTFIFVVLLFQGVSWATRESLGASSVLVVRLGFLGLIMVSIKKLRALRKKYSEIKFSLYAVVVGTFLYFAIEGGLQVISSIAESALLLLVLMVGLRSLVNSYLQKKEVVYKSLSDLSKGDSLSEHAQEILKEKAKELNPEDKKRLGEISLKSLKKEDLEVIYNLFQDNLDLRVGIYKGLVFAPLLLGAALITVIWKSSFIMVVRGVFSFF